MNEREQLRAALVIDQDDLDSCLVEQPALYTAVADAFAGAVSRRDAAKLALEEKTAELDKKVRETAFKRDQKMTNDAIDRQIALDPAIRALQREYLARRETAERWQALKEGFQQRSFMLRELVAIQLSQMANLTIERGAHGARRALDDATVELRHRAHRRVGRDNA